MVRYWVSLLLGFGSAIGFGMPSYAQSNIVADPTVGTRVTPNFLGLPIEAIRGGAERGQNLFHSFQEFNVSPDRSAFFLIPNGAIQNVFARVTGQNFSQIDGTLGVFLDGTFAGSTANLFLMNPNGINFGAGGRLNIGGSFVGTTSNAIQFGDRGSFSATASAVPLVLTINPSAFLFTQIAAQPIINQSRATNPNAPTFINGLRVNDGMSLLLLGGDIVFDSGVARAGSGRVELSGLRGLGQMNLTMNGRTLEINLPSGVPLADITLTNGAIVDVGGVVGDAFQSGGAIQAYSANLTIANSSTIRSIAFGDGDGKTLKFQVGKLSLIAGGIISAFTFGTGKSSDIEINAETIELIGLSNDRQSASAIESESRSTGLGGKAGDVVIRTQRLAVKDAAFISTQTLGQGQGGNLIVTAREAMMLSGTGTRADGRVFQSGLFSTTAGAGDAGNLRVLETGQLNVREGAVINTSTFGTGQGGNVEINANIIELIGLSNDRKFASFIGSESFSLSASGKAGDVVIRTQRLAAKDGAGVSTQTAGPGQGGNLTVTARESMMLSGTGTRADGQISQSGFSSTTFGSGGAGNLQISTRSLNIQDGGRISASATGLGRASSINVKVDDTLNMENGSISSASLFSEGGELTVTAGKIRLQGNSDIITNVFSGVGSGGNITLTANSIVALNDSDILAFARDGKGGNVTLNTRAFFGQNYRPAPFGTDPTTLDGNDRIDINASSSLSSGTIVTPDTSFIQNSLNQLPKETIDTTKLLANTCIVRKDKPEGTFYITGTGGLPNRPGDLSPSQYPTNKIVQTATRPWQKGDPIEEPQGFYQLANGRLVMSRECSSEPIVQP